MLSELQRNSQKDRSYN